MKMRLTLLYLSGISCSLSIFGAFVIFGTYYAIPDIRNFTRKLILCLTMADLLTASGYILAVYGNLVAGSTEEFITTPLCQAQGIITTYSSLVSFFLTGVIALHIFSTVVCNRTNDGLAFLIVSNAVSWIVPALIVTIADMQDVIGYNSADTSHWCWIKSYNGTTGHNNMVAWMMVTGKGWEIMCYLLTTSFYVLLKLYLYLRHRQERFNTIHTSLRDEDKNFLYVWFILYTMRLWGTIRFFDFVIDKNPTNPTSKEIMNVFHRMQAFGDPAQAFCNCILFCVLDKTVRNRLFSCCYRSYCQRQTLSRGEQAHTGSEITNTANGSGSSENSMTTHEYNTVGNYGSTLPTEHGLRDDRVSTDKNANIDYGTHLIGTSVSGNASIQSGS